jgi:FKBP-type peptidyl-prolyl cis-trans isomerase FkpA
MKRRSVFVAMLMAAAVAQAQQAQPEAAPGAPAAPVVVGSATPARPPNS